MGLVCKTKAVKSSQILSALLPKKNSNSAGTNQKSSLNQLMNHAQSNSTIGRNQLINIEQLIKQPVSQLDKTMEIDGV